LLPSLPLTLSRLSLVPFLAVPFFSLHPSLPLSPRSFSLPLRPAPLSARPSAVLTSHHPPLFLLPASSLHPAPLYPSLHAASLLTSLLSHTHSQAYAAHTHSPAYTHTQSPC